MDTNRLVAYAWGIGFDGQDLYRFPQGIEAAYNHSVHAIDPADRAQIQAEIDAVAADRFAAWPTVEEYISRRDGGVL